MFESVAALVAGVKDEIPVRLDNGLIPPCLVLVVEMDEKVSNRPRMNDCNCHDSNGVPRTPTQSDIDNAPETYSVDLGTGGCVQFNTPNRAIEEFDFYTVVRRLSRHSRCRARLRIWCRVWDYGNR